MTRTKRAPARFAGSKTARSHAQDTAPSPPRDRPDTVTSSRSRHGAADTQTLGESEYAVLSLIELSQGLTVSDDLYRAVDVLLLNLMGCLGTSRAVMWLVSDDPTDPPVLIRSQGLPGHKAEALSDECSEQLLAAVHTASTPTQGKYLEKSLGPSGAALFRKMKLSTLAPIQASGATIGLVALGTRADGAKYGNLELQLLQASLGIAGIAFQSGAIHNRLLETSRRLRIANEDLKQMDRMRAEVLANVNHELRTPLSVIVPVLDSVRETELSAAELRPFLETSAEQARKMVLLIENLLTLSELARDALSLRVVERDLTPVLTSHHAERLPGLSTELRQFVLLVPPHAVSARFDELRFRQVLDALVDNAVKFTPPGSRITIRLDEHTQDRAEWVRVRVEDNGPGIPSDQLGNLFDRFWQVDGSTTRKVGGLGIGLALARDLVDRMGGRLSVTSEEGRGATFTILLRAEESPDR
jgi:signal transduction histidine kinase